MDIGTLKEERPYLAEALTFYEKYRRFKALVSSIAPFQSIPDRRCYHPEVIETVFSAFSSSFEMPEEALDTLKEAMLSGRIDLLRFASGKTGSSDAQQYDIEEDIVFLISKPFFLSLRHQDEHDNEMWTDGRCPVCGSTPSLAFFDSDGRRHLYCSFCESSGFFKRLGCPVCADNYAGKTEILETENEKGFRVETCSRCGSYIKTVTSPEILNSYAPDLADLISLPLDIIAQGKGYRRNSPNILGIRKML